MKYSKTLLLSTTITLALAACTHERTTTDTPSTQTSTSPPAITPNTIVATESVVAEKSMTARAMASPQATQLHNQFYSYPETDRENYLPVNENNVKQVTVDPVSTFSIDVDTASYSNMRRMLAAEGRLPPHDAVRLEEMINYFSYAYSSPESTDQPFSVDTELAPSPWRAERKLLQIGLKGYEPEQTERPPANLVFLVDVSGSMQNSNKLPLVKKSLKLLLNNLNNDDRIALVVYAGAAGIVLESTLANEKIKIRNAIDQLQAGGGTHGSAGIKLAYQVAQENLIKNGINRVLIASDGDMNVGTVSIDALKELIEEKRKTGIALTTLGFGTGNYNYSLMEQLADAGNGNASYIDNLKEAHKVLVKEAQSTLMTIASDVKIQVEFNPAVVAEYRLLGYENRALKREDFTNDKVDAGEIGAGHTVTALYEITLTNSTEKRLPELRYQQPQEQEPKKSEQTTFNTTNELAYVKLRYKLPGQTQSTETASAVQISDLKPNFDDASDDFKFASAVAGFSQLLTNSKYIDQYNYQDTLKILRTSRGNDDHGYRSELISLVELAEELSSSDASGG